jgi:cation diffusion facilitator CzcD-associated flavoprotein CzcO
MDKNNEGFPFFDVIVVGAGWSGLMACKYSLGEGLKTLVLEGRDSIGGVWSFTRDRRYGGVMTTTETTSSRCITEISDFPMPESYPEFRPISRSSPISMLTATDFISNPAYASMIESIAHARLARCGMSRAPTARNFVPKT